MIRMKIVLILFSKGPWIHQVSQIFIILWPMICQTFLSYFMCTCVTTSIAFLHSVLMYFFLICVFVDLMIRMKIVLILFSKGPWIHQVSQIFIILWPIYDNLYVHYISCTCPETLVIFAMMVGPPKCNKCKFSNFSTYI